MMIKSLLSATLLVTALAIAGPASATSVGGFNIVSSADSLISSSGTFTTSGGSLSSVLTDTDAGTYALSFSPGASVTLGFSSGIVNGAGNDFVLFELGTPDTVSVTLNGTTLSFLLTATG